MTTLNRCLAAILLVALCSGCARPPAGSSSPSYWELSDTIATPPILEALWGDDSSTRLVQTLGEEDEVFGAWIGLRDSQPDGSFCLIVAGYLEPIVDDAIAGTACSTKEAYEDNGSLVFVSTASQTLMAVLFPPAFSGHTYELVSGSVDVSNVQTLHESETHVVLRYPTAPTPGEVLFEIACVGCDNVVIIRS